MARPNRMTRGQQTRSQILEAATEHFSQHGFAGARVEAIAESVGLGGPALLYHFRDKRQLYRAALEHNFRGLAVVFEQALAGPAPLAERIERALSAWVGFVSERPAVARILLREAAKVSPEISEDIAELVAPLFGLLDQVYDEGRRTGQFRVEPLDPLHLASAIAGTTVFYVAAMPALVSQSSFDPLAPEQLESHRREVLTLVRRALGLGSPRRVPSPDSDPDEAALKR